MSFVSLYFIFFSALTIIVYFIVKKQQWILLLAFSSVYFGTWGGEKIPFILISTWFAWVAGSLIGHKYAESDKLCVIADKM